MTSQPQKKQRVNDRPQTSMAERLTQKHPISKLAVQDSRPVAGISPSSYEPDKSKVAEAEAEQKRKALRARARRVDNASKGTTSGRKNTVVVSQGNHAAFDSSLRSEMEENPRKRAMSSQLKTMMYGFGDAPNPNEETMSLIEDIVTEFVQDVTRAAVAIAPQKTGITVSELKYVVRRDRTKAKVEIRYWNG